MRRTVIAASLCVAAAASFLGAEEKKDAQKSSSPAAMKHGAAVDATIHTAAGLQWVDAPPRLPAGGKATVLDGDPARPGPFIARLKMPAGYQIMPHTHPVAERVTVISGTVFVATGEKFDATSGRKLSAGDFVVFPKGSTHSAWATEEAVIQISAEGPFDMQYVDPAHDPRHQKK